MGHLTLGVSYRRNGTVSVRFLIWREEEFKAPSSILACHTNAVLGTSSFDMVRGSGERVDSHHPINKLPLHHNS